MLWKPQIPQRYVTLLLATEWQFNSGEYSVSDPCTLSALNTNTTACMAVTSDVKQYGTEQSDVGVYIRGVWIRLPGIFTHGSACFPSRHSTPAVRFIQVIHTPLKQHWLLRGLVLPVFHMVRCKQQHKNINMLLFFKYNRTGNGRKSNTVARSRNRCCREDAINITDYDCVCVFLPQVSSTQSASFLSVLYHHMYAVLLYHIYYLTHGTFFYKTNTEHKMCILICYNFCLKRF